MIKTSLGVKRYNNKIDKVWNKAIVSLQKYCEHEFFQRGDKENKPWCRKCGVCGEVDSIYNLTGICQDIPR